jgi:hypothetical protein
MPKAIASQWVAELAVSRLAMRIPQRGLPGKTGLGIYELEGDDFQFCVCQPGETERPKSAQARVISS